MSTKFGVDSSSRFPFTAWTDRHKITGATDNPTPTHGRPQWTPHYYKDITLFK